MKLLKSLEHKFYEAKRSGVIQPREKEAQGRRYCYLQLPERSLQQGGSLFSQATSKRTKGDGLKL